MVGPEKYPRLTPDSPATSRFTSAGVATYVGLEERGWEAYTEQDVKFIRSAACEGFNVWLWSCRTENGEVYVYACSEARRFGPTSLGTNFDSVSEMTAEEYLKALGYWPSRGVRRVR